MTKIHDAKDMDLDTIFDCLKNDELGILLLRSETKCSFCDVLASQTSWYDCLGMINNHKEHITYHLFSLCYKNELAAKNIDAELVHNRSSAYHIIFQRWTAAGYNTHHAKNPFNSKAFCKFIDEIGFYNADYLLLYESE